MLGKLMFIKMKVVMVFDIIILFFIEFFELDIEISLIKEFKLRRCLVIFFFVFLYFLIFLCYYYLVSFLVV